MEIQNFETAYLNAGGKASELEKEDGEYVSSKAQMGWQMWQAAAALAVPDGFVLVPKEPTEQLLSKAIRKYIEVSDLSIITNRMAHLYDLMIQEAVIEAQEQSHV